VTDAERAHLDNLLTIGRASLHALDRTIRYSDSEDLPALATERQAIAADVDRLTLVLGA